MSQFRLPCIVCENGDPYSNIVCDNCECSIEHRKETYEAIVSLVMDINDLVGDMPHALYHEVEDKVKPIYDLLVALRIEDTRKKNDKLE